MDLYIDNTFIMLRDIKVPRIKKSINKKLLVYEEYPKIKLTLKYHRSELKIFLYYFNKL